MPSERSSSRLRFKTSRFFMTVASVDGQGPSGRVAKYFVRQLTVDLTCQHDRASVLREVVVIGPHAL
jgi:hypothetical protein